MKLKINAIHQKYKSEITEEMCNGNYTFLIENTDLFNHHIKAEIITGESINEEVFIPRITLNAGDSSSFPFTLFRKQFPVVG